MMSRIASEHPLFPMPICLLGANVAGKPNFNTIAWFNMVDFQPDMVGISSDKGHHTNKGIHENKTFSINILSADMVAATDYIDRPIRCLRRRQRNRHRHVQRLRSVR